MATFARVAHTVPEAEVWPTAEEERALLAALRAEIAATVAVPAVGGRLVEPMDDARLRRFLGARRYDVGAAAALFARHWRFRARTFGARPLCAPDASAFLRALGDDARDAAGRPRLLLDLARLDLGHADDAAFEAARPALLETVWAVVDACLALHGAAAARLGLVLQVDARGAAPQRHLRPRRVRALLDGVAGHLPARLAAVEVVGAPPWLPASWKALEPLLGRKAAARTQAFTVAEARAALGAAATAAFLPDAGGCGDLAALEAGAAPTARADAAAAPPPAAAAPPPPRAPAPKRAAGAGGVDRARVAAIVAELGAHGVPEPPGVLSWSEDAVFMYYASDGAVTPKPGAAHPIAEPPGRGGVSCARRSSYQREYYC